MKVRFWLLDLSTETVEGRPEVRLWGVDDRGQRILVADRSAAPALYLLPQPGADPAALRDEVLKTRDRLKKIAGAEVVKRRLLGSPLTAIRVTTLAVDSAAQSRIVKQLSKIPGISTVLEDDLRLSVQYLLERRVVPSSWHEVEADPLPLPEGSRVAAAWLARSSPESLEIATAPPLRLLSMNFLAYSPSGTPRATRDPVVLLAAATGEGEERLWTAADGDDAPALAAFAAFLRDYDPDLVFGYGINRRGWPYLLRRARQAKVPFDVDRGGGPPHPSLYGHISLLGRANVDLFDFAGELGEVKVKKLENVAPFLGLEVSGERIEEFEVPACWLDPARRHLLVEQTVRDTILIREIGRSMLDYSVEMSRLVGLPLDQVAAAAAGFRAEQFLLKAAHRLGELAPKRIDRPFLTYAGGLVLAPKPGLHEEVAVLDFKSMYPNLMIRYNLSPDTYVPPDREEPECPTHLAPEVGHRFRKDPPGFYKKVLTDLIAARDVIRRRLEASAAGSTERKVLDVRQKVVKILTNAIYGYAGWAGARWYLKQVPEAAAAWGRATIISTQEIARELGLEVLYCDTDSLFLKHDPVAIERFVARVTEELGLEIRPEKVYRRLLFTEAKKRYAGLLDDGKLEVVGLEVVRGDWSQAAKEAQEKVLGIILRGRPIEEARDEARRLIGAVRAGQVPYRDLVIWKTLTKPLRLYEARAPHVEAARRLFQAGYSLTIGDHVGYVIVKGDGKLFERAIPYHLTGYDAVDPEYYATHQVAPAVARVLEGFGIGEKELLE